MWICECVHIQSSQWIPVSRYRGIKASRSHCINASRQAGMPRTLIKVSRHRGLKVSRHLGSNVSGHRGIKATWFKCINASPPERINANRLDSGDTREGTRSNPSHSRSQLIPSHPLMSSLQSSQVRETQHSSPAVYRSLNERMHQNRETHISKK